MLVVLHQYQKHKYNCQASILHHHLFFVIQGSPHGQLFGHSWKGQSLIELSLNTVVPSGQIFSSLGHLNMHLGGISVLAAQVIPSG
jgi:hypothetical protein